MPKKRDENAPYWVQMRQAERSIIEFALEHGQTIRGTAAILGISPNFLSERLRELGVPAPEVRPGPKPGTKPTRPQKPVLRVVDGNGSAPSPDTLDEDEEPEDADTDEGVDDPDEDEDEDEDDAEDQDDDAQDAAEDDEAHESGGN